MAVINVQVSLRNTTGSSIVLGTLSIGAGVTVSIWDTVNYIEASLDNFVQVRDNIAVFNEGIGNGNLVMVVGSDLLAQAAWDQFQELMYAYLQYDIALTGFSMLRAEGENIHGALSGLDADDHVQYLLTDGTRAMSGSLDMDGYNIIDVGLINSIDITNHSARHDPGGADALTTAAAVGLTANSTSTEGTAVSFARSDHTHAIDVTTGTISTVNAGDTSSDGTAIGLARRDHQHAVATATAVAVGTANAEGTSTSLARADHTHQVTGLTITSQAQGDILYYNGSSWVRLPAGTDGYFLSTNGVGANPSWESANSSLTTAVPVNVTKSANAEGTAASFARSDHKHDISTAAASGINAGSTNTEGSATTVARSDHTHAIDVTTGTISTVNAGDTSSDGTAIGLARRDHQHAVATATAVAVGTANAEGTSTSIARADHTHQVTGLTITSQAQGDILYYNGSSWVRLAAGTDGYYLQTNGVGANPSWEAVVGGSGSGDVVGPSGATDNAIARYDTATGKLIQNSSVTIDDNGNMYLNTDGSNTTNPRVFGVVNFSADEAIRWEFGDSANVIQNSYGGSMTLYAYHSIILRGDRNTATPPGFDTTSDIGVLIANSVVGSPAFVVDGASGQTADLQQWRVNGGAALLSVSAAGNIVMGGAQTVDGVDVSDHSARHDPGGADALTTAAAVGLTANSTSTEGTAVSFARSDHTHAIDVTTGTISTVNAGDTSSDGTAIGLARRDHQHAVATATAVAVGTANAEGTSTSLARADHTHQVTGLTITSQAQGDILYYNGSSWVRLAAGTDGYYLQTNGVGANPSWEAVVGGSGSGDVVGPSGATDNAIARYDTATGKLIQNSVAILGDTGNLTGINDLTSARYFLGTDIGLHAVSGGQSVEVSYYGLQLRGNHRNDVDAAFVPVNVGNTLDWCIVIPSSSTQPEKSTVGIITTSGQTTSALQICDSSLNALLTIDASGNISFSSTQTVDGVDVSDHDARHIKGGADEIDGDLIDIDYQPANYSRITGSPGSDIEHLAAHLRGIDDKLSGIADGYLGGGYSYFAIYAAENGALATSQYEWSFGANEGNSNSGGVIIPVACELYALSLDHQGTSGTATVAAQKNGTQVATVSTSAQTGVSTVLGSPVSFAAGDRLNFYTTAASASSSSANRVAAIFRVPLNLTIASAAQGDILYYTGSAWSRLPAGTDGYYLQTNGAGANPSWEPVSASGGLSGVHTFAVSTCDYTAIDVQQNSAVWGSLLIPTADITINRMQCQVTQSASGNVYFAIYDVDFNKLGDETTGVSCSTNGIKTATLSSSVSLSAGTPYYFCIRCTANGSRFSGHSSTSSSVTPQYSIRKDSAGGTDFPSSFVTPSANAQTLWISGFSD